MPRPLLFEKTRISRVVVLLAALLTLTAGCTRLRNNTSTPRVPGLTVPPSNGVLTPEPLTPPITTDVAPAQSDGNVTDGDAPLTLTVLSPQDGETVSTPQVVVRGASTPGAVVTVNDDILIVGDDGQFQSTVLLEEGSNLIEIVASNDVGDEQSLELGIAYQP